MFHFPQTPLSDEEDSLWTEKRNFARLLVVMFLSTRLPPYTVRMHSSISASEYRGEMVWGLMTAGTTLQTTLLWLVPKHSAHTMKPFTKRCTGGKTSGAVLCSVRTLVQTRRNRIKDSTNKTLRKAHADCLPPRPEHGGRGTHTGDGAREFSLCQLIENLFAGSRQSGLTR
jgi:hypothetical protein